jgi:hypothetical protein
VRLDILHKEKLWHFRKRVVQCELALNPSRPASSANSHALLWMKDLVTLILSMHRLITSLAKCEHTRILRALIENPQGNLEEIQQKPCRAPKMNLGGRPYRKAAVLPILLLLLER